LKTEKPGLLKIKITILFAFILITVNLCAQSDTNKKRFTYVQLSGIVTDQNNNPLSYVHVINSHKGNATITDEEGIFSLVVKRNDRVILSSVGYKKDTILIPDSIDNYVIFIDIRMKTDTILLSTVNILPWATYEEFREAFRNLKVENDESNYAKKNVELVITQIKNELSYNPDPGLNYKYTMQDNIQSNIMKGTYPTLSLLNPLAWAQFFEGLKNGMFKSKKTE
jgi:hypothetical protein